jgi:hypothetical protein
MADVKLSFTGLLLNTVAILSFIGDCPIHSAVESFNAVVFTAYPAAFNEAPVGVPVVTNNEPAVKF